MSLRGSLETFELPDVLALVAGTTKTGKLEVTTDRGVGLLAFSEGKLMGAELDDLTAPVEVLARLLRAVSGEFTFDARVVDGDGDGDGEDVATLLAEANTLVAEWVEIERVVPSPDCMVTLAEVPPAATITLSAEQWTLIAAVAGGCTVRELARYLSVDDLDASRGVKNLVETGVAVVGADGTLDERPGVVFVPEPQPEPAAPEVETVAHADDDEDNEDEHDEDPALLVRQLASLTVDDKEVESALAGPFHEVGSAEPAETATAQPGAEGEPVSRGALLKFLSSVRT